MPRPTAIVPSSKSIRATRALFGLGNALLMAGRADEAEICFRQVIKDHPDVIAAHSNLLLCLHYRKGDDGPALHREHVEWARRHAVNYRR